MQLIKDNRLIISASLIATIFAVSLVGDYPLTVAFITAGVIMLINVILLAPSLTLTSIIITAEATFIASLNASVIAPAIPLMSIYDAYAGINLLSIALQFLAFLIFPLMAILFYFKVLGRVWVNLAIVVTLFNSALLIFLFYQNVLIISISALISLLIGISIVLVKSYFINRKYATIEPPKSLMSKTVKLLIKSDKEFKHNVLPYGQEVIKGGSSFLIHKPYGKDVIKFAKGFVLLGKKPYNREVESLLVESSKSTDGSLILISEDMGGSVRIVKMKSPRKPDVKMKSFLIMSEETLKEFLLNK